MAQPNMDGESVETDWILQGRANRKVNPDARYVELRRAVQEVFGTCASCARFHGVSKAAMVNWLTAGDIPVRGVAWNKKGIRNRLKHHMCAVKAEGFAQKYPAKFWNRQLPD